MDQAARRKNELLDRMESCRAAGGDLNDPQFAELASALAQDAELRTRFEFIQRADAAIKVVFADVPAPSDLAERISRRLRADFPDTFADRFVAPARNSVGKSETVPFAASPLSERPSLPDSPAPPCPDPAVAAPRRSSRRRWIAGISAIAATAAVLTGLWLRFHEPSSITQQRALEGAIAFFSQDNDQSSEPTSTKPPPNDYPISRDIVQLPNVRWRHIDKFLGSKAVAYDLPSVGARATLYVAHCTVAELPPYAPLQPTWSTGGKSAAAWQSGGMLYVLVVQGDARTYASYLASFPLT